MKDTTSRSDAYWRSEDLADHAFYESLAEKLDKRGKLVAFREGKFNPAHYFKNRIYHVSRCTVSLSEETSTACNQYVVNVKLNVYAQSERVAKKLLEDLVGESAKE